MKTLLFSLLLLLSGCGFFNEALQTKQLAMKMEQKDRNYENAQKATSELNSVIESDFFVFAENCEYLNIEVVQKIDDKNSIGQYRNGLLWEKPKIIVADGVDKNVFIHEMMHSIGINHNIDKSSVMYWQQWSDEQHITKEDKINIRGAVSFFMPKPFVSLWCDLR